MCEKRSSCHTDNSDTTASSPRDARGKRVSAVAIAIELATIARSTEKLYHSSDVRPSNGSAEISSN